MEFRPFDKIPRLRRGIVLTEKIDGTNASVCITREPLLCAQHVIAYRSLGDGEGLIMRAGSRTRWITPEDDNFGFAAWVKLHASELFALGEGHHFGEWWGNGIQRGYGLQERRFSLFNAGRWINYEEERTDEKQRVVPHVVSVVPVLARSSVFDTSTIEATLNHLRQHGSRAAPGYMNPEGIVIFHEASGQSFKYTIEKDDEPKGGR